MYEPFDQSNNKLKFKVSLMYHNDYKINNNYDKNIHIPVKINLEGL